MKYLLCLWLLSPLLYAAPCPTAQAKDEAALLQIEHTWVEAVENRDVASLDCILASDFEEVGPQGQLMDRSSTLRDAASPQQEHVELSDIHAHIYGDAAWVRGVGVVMKGGKITAKTRFTDIFVYRDGRWQCVAGQGARLAEPHP